MKTWYRCVCDEHKEMIDMFVNNIETTYHYLKKDNDIINTFLSKHYGCKLRLIYLDDELDECFNNKYIKIKG